MRNDRVQQEETARPGQAGGALEAVQAQAPPAAEAASLGDRLFALVEEARAAGVDAEQALRDANGRFERALRAARDAS